ncbi:MAG: hypothetical protein A3A33_04660 [Candidatus Yanofskybacteria bacterium RIFCSPLOWO2_01_FULL_49_25]|uniref:Carboxypeptidase regulatory-like domain-containing protein n=1 Tax=Candidatus Yanofskybacteria bacterium RIFCSPLOWO2_01_FULL_49_25 TaxID=1802701 RepID=A0A1F8GPX1_9BACT|nr:MAG: hypothetical protein A3A33_04660 [Candidatus Yanofskybacteria bacterium RIFCSPLOWO2_01_FULL_49_25]
MKTIKIGQEEDGFAPVGIVAVLLVLAVAGYVAFTTEVAVRRQTTPTPTSSYVPPFQGYNINPDTIDPSRSVSPTPIPNGLSGAYGKILVEKTIGPAASRSPYVGTMIVKIRSTNTEYARFQTNAQGSYSITLPPNTYYLIPADGTWPWATDSRYARDIVVRGGAFTKADLTLIANAAQ